MINPRDYNQNIISDELIDELFKGCLPDYSNALAVSLPYTVQEYGWFGINYYSRTKITALYITPAGTSTAINIGNLDFGTSGTMNGSLNPIPVKPGDVLSQSGATSVYAYFAPCVEKGVTINA